MGRMWKVGEGEKLIPVRRGQATGEWEDASILRDSHGELAPFTGRM